MFAMQRINDMIVNPIFLLLFLGTPALCSVIAIDSALMLNEPGRVWLLAGALAYLIGPFGITLLFNVPLNQSIGTCRGFRCGRDVVDVSEKMAALEPHTNVHRRGIGCAYDDRARLHPTLIPSGTRACTQ